MPLIDDVNGVGCVPVPWRNARVELHAHVFSAVRNYGVGVQGHDHVCAIFADSAPSNVCDHRRSWNFGGYLLGSLWFIGRSEREVYGDHKNRFNLGSTALRFLARAA